MKNFYILLLITVVLLSGCSKASQTGSAVETYGVANAAVTQSADTGVYAYIPYWSGRIDSYIVRDGKFEKTGEVKVAPILCTPIATPTGEFLYTFDNKFVFTRFKIDKDGQLSDPIETKPDLAGQNISDMSIHPSGKFLLLTTSGRDSSSEARVGGVIVLSIRTDGTVDSNVIREAVPYTVQRAVFAPSGNYLYIKSPRGILTYSINTAGVITEKSVSTAVLGSTGVMTLDGEGSRLLVGENKEYSRVVLCAVNEDKVNKISSIAVSQESGYGITTSLAVDAFGNVVTINANNWLACYKLQADRLTEGNTYLNFRDHKWMSKSDAIKALPATAEYAQRLKEVETRPDRENAALFGAYIDLGSQLATARLAPDGNIYVSTTSGVYKFKSTADGIVYDSPAITWQDTSYLFRGNTQASFQEQRDAEPISDGMIFVQRK